MRRMRFRTWAKKDVNDERKINYIMRTYDGKVIEFSSDEEVSFSMLTRIAVSWIDKIELVNNQWNVSIYE